MSVDAEDSIIVRDYQKLMRAREFLIVLYQKLAQTIKNSMQAVSEIPTMAECERAKTKCLT